MFSSTWSGRRLVRRRRLAVVRQPIRLPGSALLPASQTLLCLEFSGGEESPSAATGAQGPAFLFSAYVALLVLAALALVYLAVKASRNEEGGRIVAIVVLCTFSMLFWGFFELAGSLIQIFVNQKMDLMVLGWKLESTFINNVINPTLIVLMGVFFSAIWVWLDRRGLEPSSPVKFSLGLLQLGLGFLVLWLAALRAGPAGKSSVLWLVLAYFIITTGELCLSPIGLSMITKLAPARLVGMFMGVWFLTSAIGNVLTGGFIGPLQEKHGFAPVFLGIAGCTGVAALLLFALTPLLKRLMHGIK